MRLLSMVILVAACGGGSASRSASSGPTTPARPVVTAPQLEPAIGELRWYRSVSTCAQGPFEVELPVTGNKWGEEWELRLATPRKIALHTVVLVDGVEVAKDEATLDRDGRTSGAPDNSRCVADARERLVLGRSGGGGGGSTPGTPVVPGTRVPADPVGGNASGAPLEIAEEPGFAPSTVVHVRLDRPPPVGARVRIKFWSIEPNDLTGVLFGAVRIAWRPNIGEVEYEAYLERIRQEDEARRARYAQEEAERRARLEQEREALRIRLAAEEEERRRNYRPPARDLEAERRAREEAERRARLEAERERVRLEQDRLRAEQDRLRREREEAERLRREEELRRRRAIEIALEVERVRRRQAWCDAHHDSRDCWGAGGFKMKVELDQRSRERDTYCTANPDDARCWSSAERARRKAIWDVRVTAARTPPKPPDGPPPAPLADPQPPKLSENAEWRPGYWQWIDGNWVWLVGQWRVPDSDVEQERTTRAPSAPPPPKVETIAVAPAATVVWTSGYWMWNSTQWIWVPGSWQLRPRAGVRWRAPEWRVRGSIHILVPGGWTR